MDWGSLKDALWNWFAFWGPVFRDVLSVVLAAVGALLAFQAIRMGKRQESIALEQGAIAKRQADIAEKQHQIELEQLAKRAVLSLQTGGSSSAFTDDTRTVHLQTFTVCIVNSGTRTARDIYWQISAPYIARCKPAFEALAGNVDVKEDVVYEFPDDIEGLEHAPFPDEFPALTGRCVGPIYPDQQVECAVISVAIPHADFQKAKLEHCDYFLACDDGRFPAEGLQRLDLRMFLVLGDPDGK